MVLAWQTRVSRPAKPSRSAGETAGRGWRQPRFLPYVGCVWMHEAFDPLRQPALQGQGRTSRAAASLIDDQHPGTDPQQRETAYPILRTCP